jgi:hypothetical protein
MTKRLLTLALLLHAAALPALGKALPTNFVQTISLNLSFVGTNKTLASGASAVSNAVVTSKTAIAAFGTALGQKFSANAQFLELIPIAYYTNGRRQYYRIWRKSEVCRHGRNAGLRCHFVFHFHHGQRRAEPNR